MQFECPVCQAPYNVPDDRLTQTVNKAVCKKCGTTMLINKETGEVEQRLSNADPNSEPDIKDTRLPDDTPSVLSMAAQQQGKKDYLAIMVVVFALFILIGAGAFLVMNIGKSFSGGPFKSITRFLDDLSDVGKFFSGEVGQKKQIRSKPARKAKKYMQRGYRNYKQERYKKAVAEYSKALQLDSANPNAYFWRARSLLKIGRYDKAIADLKETVKLDPGYSKAYDNLGWLYMKRGQYDKSISYLNKSIKLKSDNGWAYYTRAHIRIKKGDVEKGLIDANRACNMGYKDGCKLYQKHKQ
ncbi:MAG: tetratricopeptide repeat protein [Desulfobacterales bacterium]|jgi:predicted Zn finger-like uncharacterized protein